MTENLAPQIESFVQAEHTKVQKEEVGSIEELPAELLEISREIASISGRWNPVEIFTPTSESIAAEKSKFFDALKRDEEYIPTFDYHLAKNLDTEVEHVGLHHINERLHNFRPKNRHEKLAKIALMAKVRDDQATINLVEGIKLGNEEQIRHALTQKYPPIDQFLFHRAQQEYIHRSTGTKEEPVGEGMLYSDERTFLDTYMLDAQGIAEAFTWALEQYGMLDKGDGIGFAVRIDTTATSIDVRDKSQGGSTIVVPSSRRMNGKKLLELISHEIEAHARQSVNGKRLFKIGGGNLKVDDETLYEGLAMRNEENFYAEFYGEPYPLPTSVILYPLAIERAEAGESFAEIFHHIENLYLHILTTTPPSEPLPEIQEKDRAEAQENAWGVTYRVMRGHTDMSNTHAFAMSKDLAYLRGYILDKELRQTGFGFINESSIIATKGLNLLSNYEMSPEILPIKYQNITRRYWEEVLKPLYILDTLSKTDSDS